jgi:hypothetical protein
VGLREEKRVGSAFGENAFTLIPSNVAPGSLFRLEEDDRDREVLLFGELLGAVGGAESGDAATDDHDSKRAAIVEHSGSSHLALSEEK